MKAFRFFAIALFVFFTASLSAQNVLVLESGSTIQASSQAATSLGYTVTIATNEGQLFDALCPGGPCNYGAWDLVVIDSPFTNLGDDASFIIKDYVDSGGRAILSYGDLDSNSGDGMLLREAFMIDATATFDMPLDIQAWVPTHPIWSVPNTLPLTISFFQDVTIDDGDRLTPAAGATILGGFAPVGTPGEGAIVLGNLDRTICNGFVYENFELTTLMPLLANEMQFLITTLPVGTEFIRGDCNNDSTQNIADVVYFLGNLFPSGVPNVLDCLDACDANDDGNLDIADAVAALDSLFGMPATPLPAPNPTCGLDPTDTDPLDCAMYSGCP